ERVTLVILRADLAADPEAAAPPAGTSGIRHEGITLDYQRILRLERLDRQVRRVRDVHVHAVEPVLRRASAGAAADRLQGDVEPAGPRVDAAERRRHARAVTRGDDAI